MKSDLCCEIALISDDCLSYICSSENHANNSLEMIKRVWNSDSEFKRYVHILFVLSANLEHPNVHAQLPNYHFKMQLKTCPQPKQVRVRVTTKSFWEVSHSFTETWRIQTWAGSSISTFTSLKRAEEKKVLTTVKSNQNLAVTFLNDAPFFIVSDHKISHPFTKTWQIQTWAGSSSNTFTGLIRVCPFAHVEEKIVLTIVDKSDQDIAVIFLKGVQFFINALER